MLGCLCCRAMLGNPQPSSSSIRDVNSNAPEVENYEVFEFVQWLFGVNNNVTNASDVQNVL